MSARIEIQVECGSCDRIEWCGLFDEGGFLTIDAPEGWFVGPACRWDGGTGTPVVRCPDHGGRA